MPQNVIGMYRDHRELRTAYQVCGVVSEKRCREYGE